MSTLNLGIGVVCAEASLSPDRNCFGNPFFCGQVVELVPWRDSRCRRLGLKHWLTNGYKVHERFCWAAVGFWVSQFTQSNPPWLERAFGLC